jgi:hypothetical protein
MSIDAPKPRHVAGDLLLSDKVELWTHFQQQGGDDKNKMIATVSWLLGLVVALLAISVGELVEGKDPPRPLVALLLSLLGLLLCVTAVTLIRTFFEHALLRYQAAERIEKEIEIPYLVYDKTRGPRKLQWFKGVGRIFDYLGAMSILLGTLTIVVVVIALAMLIPRLLAP